jgi:hypothetical protein
LRAHVRNVRTRGANCACCRYASQTRPGNHQPSCPRHHAPQAQLPGQNQDMEVFRRLPALSEPAMAQTRDLITRNYTNPSLRQPLNARPDLAPARQLPRPFLRDAMPPHNNARPQGPEAAFAALHRRPFPVAERSQAPPPAHLPNINTGNLPDEVDHGPFWGY